MRILGRSQFPWAGQLPLAELKRLLERFCADPEFSTQLLQDPQSAARSLGFSWNPEQVRALYDPQATGPVGPEVEAYRAYMREKLRYRAEIRQGLPPSDPVYRVWRERQVARSRLELGLNRADSIVHASMCFELNQGCSVGCWFCGVGAPKLSDIWPYSEENASLWRATLTTMRELVGPAAASGFCYWATDPLDNPDYERFCLDFADILGVFPQTTTALGLRDPERVRALLRLSEDRGCRVNRFSILTLKQYRKVQEVYSADELVNVECIPQNKESNTALARAGKAAQSEARADEVAGPAGTIACVSGFLFNMVAGSVRLITPCATSDRWPLGYWILDEATFRDAETLQREVRRMVAALPTSVKDLPQARLARFLQWRAREDGLELGNSLVRMPIGGPQQARGLQEIARLLGEGRHSAEEIALLCRFTAGLHPDYTLDALELMFRSGALDEEPSPYERELPAQAVE